jgi:dethiobiotin synthetase
MRIGITGTDTGVGKTTIACALLALLRDAGVRTAAMKPVDSGVLEEDSTSDGARLQSMATEPHPIERVRPYVFPDPVAPLAAAERVGVTISLERLDRAFETLSATADAVIVEGAGGALVPISDALSVLDLFRHWSLEVIIVAANRLGVINHALLTEQAIHSAGLRLRGIVLVDGTASDPSSATNRDLLARLTSTPVFRFPHLRDPFDPREAAAAAAGAGLVSLIDNLTPSIGLVT